MALYIDQIIKVNYYIPDRDLVPPEVSEDQCLECLTPCDGDFCSKQCEQVYIN